MLSRIRYVRGALRAAPLLGFVIFAFALWALHHELRGIRLSDLLQDFRNLPGWRIGLAIAVTAFGYLTLTGYDVLALRYVDRPLPYRRVALPSMVAFAVGNNVGMSLLTAGGVRYRFYSAAGLAGVEIATVVGMIGFTVGFGIGVVIAAALTLRPAAMAAPLHLPASVAQGIGIVMLAIALAYLGWTASRPAPLRLRDWLLRVPSLGMSCAQIVLAVLDLALASLALYVLLPGIDVPYPAFVVVFTVALAVGIASHVPGGVGVFEAALLLGLPNVPREQLLAGILAFRCVYYFLPLLLAAVAMGAHELHLRRRGLAQVGRTAGDWWSRVAPQVLGLAVLLGGTILLFSGAIPALDARITLLRPWLPLAVLELSHLLGSAIGLMLLILARGLYRRLASALHLTLVLLAMGVIVSLLKGFDVDEALVLASILALLWLARSAFYRHGSLLDQPFTVGWWMTLAVIVAGSIWLGLLGYRNVEYANQLWWKFAFDSNAPRFLRASVVVIVLLIAFAARKLLRGAPPAPQLPGAIELKRAASIVGESPRPETHLALTGDKCLLFDDEDEAFIMYQVHGHSWVAMGDPVGPPAAQERLAWRFLELCDRHGGVPVFYQVSGDGLAMYVDLGLSLVKLGEEARVDLSQFSLTGRAAAEFRQVRRRAERDGATFELVEPPLPPEFITQLRHVSDAWLKDKHTAEKRFSVGFFQPTYLVDCPCAVIRRDGRITAFANLWRGAGVAEMAVDLMRFDADAPYGAMDYLFVELMLWSKAQGCPWFSLGMAPLAGLETHRLAPVWHRLGTLVYRHGEHFYNFEGLRHYKGKFHPVWSPRYMAARGGFALPRILLDVASLIAGGTKGIVAR